MLLLRRPSTEMIRAYVAAQANQALTYADVGATSGTPPTGYMVDHTRVKLGEGEPAFRAAKAALERWQQFQLGWLEAGPADTPIKKDQVVAILARSLGAWWLNACRIVAVIDQADGPVVRFGFASGTLPDHAGTGEERFLIEWDRQDNSVTYDILAFSRPRHLLTRVGYRWMRIVQARFGRQSAAAMRRAVEQATQTC